MITGKWTSVSWHVVHWEIREQMKTSDVKLILQRDRERWPDTKPRLITDNGPHLIAPDFKYSVRDRTVIPG
jgi:hypothetical protein